MAGTSTFELHRDAEMEALRRENARLRAVNDQVLAENRELRARLAKYEPQAAAPSAAAAPGGTGAAAQAGASPGNYSLGRFEASRKKREKRAAPERAGRRSTAEKMAAAGEVRNLYPAGARPKACVLVGERAVWRIENGRAVLVGYRIFQSPDGRVAEVPDTLPGGEYDILIVAAVGWLAYGMRLSLDQTCLLFETFWGLQLPKSQADSLLNQLAKHWGLDFERLCDILRISPAVGTDETGWTIGNAPSNAAIFVTPYVLVLIFGCPKGRETVHKILNLDLFSGVIISDDHASYQGLNKAQKCWAHLIRKLIKLSLLYPQNELYHRMLDELLEFYNEAKRRAQDKRLGAAGRKRTARQLAEWLSNIVAEYARLGWKPQSAGDEDFKRLMLEIDRLCQFGELLVFVENPEVPPTNNAAEQGFRGAAAARKTNRTSQSAKGAARRTIITSVLESLKRGLPRFTLQAVADAMRSAMQAGQTMFDELFRKLGGTEPTAAAHLTAAAAGGSLDGEAVT